METILNGFKAEIEAVALELRKALLFDTQMLREDTQQLGRAYLHALGRALVHGAPLEQENLGFSAQTIISALRHAGTYVLGQCGDSTTKTLANWSADIRDGVDCHYAEDQACDLLEEMQAHLYVKTAATAFFDAMDEDDNDRDKLERELITFEEITSSYRTALLTDAQGLKALTWAAKRSNLLANFWAMLPEGATAPYYLDPQWYREHGANL